VMSSNYTYLALSQHAENIIYKTLISNFYGMQGFSIVALIGYYADSWKFRHYKMAFSIRQGT